MRQFFPVRAATGLQGTQEADILLNICRNFAYVSCCIFQALKMEHAFSRLCPCAFTDLERHVMPSIQHRHILQGNDRCSISFCSPQPQEIQMFSDFSAWSEKCILCRKGIPLKFSGSAVFRVLLAMRVFLSGSQNKFVMFLF